MMENEVEAARLLEAIRRVCDVTGNNAIEIATLAYERGLQDAVRLERKTALGLSLNDK